MSIAVIDQATELYWFISNALLQDQIPLKHLNTIQTGEEYILQYLPSVVVLSGDDPALMPAKFIAKIRNHVFARNTLFIVITSDTSYEYKKSLLIAGAGQVIYRGRKEKPSPQFFRSLIQWFFNLKSPEPQLFEYTPVPFPGKGDFSTYGRVGWISKNQCYIEINLDLKVGEKIDFKNPLLDELEIKNTKLVVVEKNKTGRYYQYSNGYLCQIESKNPTKDANQISDWIKNHPELSKDKPVKVVYYEPAADNREKIKNIIKMDKRYCARGFADLENLSDDLEYQLPHLVLINRLLISQDKNKFPPIKKFMESHFCFCVTYDPEGLTDLEEYKQNYPFAMHVTKILGTELFESMISKLEEKLLAKKDGEDTKKVIFNKYSAYSRISVHSPCQIIAVAPLGISLTLPFAMSPYCAFGVVSPAFPHLSLNLSQYFRNFISKKTAGGLVHQCLFFGQTSHENELIKNTTDKIAELGYDQWKAGDKK